MRNVQRHYGRSYIVRTRKRDFISLVAGRKHDAEENDEDWLANFELASCSKGISRGRKVN